MLSRIGFRYAERVDPFDGGPHFIAPTDEITLIRGVQPVSGVEVTPAAGATALFAREMPAAPFFVAVVGELSEEKALLSPDVGPRFDWLGGPFFALRILDPAR